MDKSKNKKTSNFTLAESIVRTVRNPILVLDKNLTVISANKAFYDTFLVSKETTISNSLYDLGNGQWEIKRLRMLLEDVLTSKHEIFDYEVTHNFPSIGNKVMMINARRIETEEDKKELLLLSIEDITTRREKEQKLQAISDELYLEKEKAKNTLLSIGDGLIVTNEFAQIVEFNPISVQLTGYSEKEAIGRPFHEIFNIFDEKTMQKREDPVKEVIETNRPTSIKKNTILISKNKKEYFIEDSVAPINNKQGKLTGVVCIYRDVTSLKNKIIENEYSSTHDYLTNLYNRRSFITALSTFDKNKHYPLGIMMMDVNGLKIFNDAFGHTVGDKVLQKISEILISILDPKQLYRTGGDEFSSIIPNCSENKLLSLKEKINACLSNTSINHISLSLAIGFCIKEHQDEHIQDVLKFAENNMYKTKIYAGKSHRNHAINAIINTLTSKYQSEKKHSTRVSELCVAIGKELGLKVEELKELEMAGMYHDIGKISIPDTILRKPGKLTEKEYNVIKTHTEIGYHILRSADEYSDLAKYALSHHERIDGKGYPNGLVGDEISLFSKIICIADSYEAMTSNRPYRKAMSKQEAIIELKANIGTQFDANLIDVFLTRVLKESSV